MDSIENRECRERRECKEESEGIECKERVLADKYEIKRKIGEGGSGVVYMAWDRHLECMVAIKEEKEVLMKDGEDINFLKKEMEFLRSLSHPMLPAVIDYFVCGKRYLVMEYIEGESLYGYIIKEGKIPENTACEWALQLLALLSYLHSQKPAIIYRDLKPENIIISPDSKLKLVDFGSAFYMRYNCSFQESLSGTIGYAAPEQLGGEDQYSGMADERSDIYNFGAVLYHMLTGFNPSLPPYGVRAPRLINPELSSQINRIVLKCTAIKPSERYQSVEEIKRELTDIKSGRKKFFHVCFKKKRSYIIKKIEKNICLTDKKGIDLI